LYKVSGKVKKIYPRNPYPAPFVVKTAIEQSQSRKAAFAPITILKHNLGCKRCAVLTFKINRFALE